MKSLFSGDLLEICDQMTYLFCDKYLGFSGFVVWVGTINLNGIYQFPVVSVLELLLQLKTVWQLKWQSLWKKLKTASLKLKDSQTNLLQVRHSTAVQLLIQFYRLSLKQSIENEYLDSPSHHSFRMNRQLHCQTILYIPLYISNAIA